MTKRMLIDAAHPEETRVVIVDGTRVEELDFESRNKRQLRGNVYLAKVTRVEPSLQAAFIDYGGNRHGFLAFSEIHPDYYQLPYEDKLALQEQEAEELSDLEDADDDDVEEDVNLDPDADDATDESDAEVADEQVKVASRRRQRMKRRRYKIQEVIKRGQILLVQAVKEERGNKGAAMTTYLSLAGRYCVLMPNTPRGGGISRKIPNGADRKRLKTIVDGLDVPQGVGVIVRTAGAKRTKAEITRDYTYLSRLWSEIRETTLSSIAPALIHEEGNLVKRSIRDLYNKEIEEVLVQGEEAYKTAKGFIKMLMPSHAKFVKRYDDEIPLLLRFNVERQIENSLDATVQLKSGGYLVIHPTEALVSVDVNSGRSTKERNVERTALKTNLEAAEELARQMRLRDLAGLIVVDFIDMDENKNNRAVERKMKESLSRDRARIQTSRISQFGLMEISRQRRRRSLLEGSTTICPHCSGVGRKRTVESAALAAIRAVEDFAIRGKAKKIRLKCPPDVALYLLNEKRDLLTKVDEDTDVFTIVEHDEDLIRPAFLIEVAEKRSDGRNDPLIAIEKELREEQKQSARNAAKAKQAAERSDSDDDDDDDDAADTSVETDAKEDRDEDSKPRRRRGRRGGRNRRKRTSDSHESDSSDNQDSDKDDSGKDDETSSEDKPKPRRRRRAPAKSRAKDGNAVSETEDASETDTPSKDDEASPAPKRSSRRRKAPPKSGGSDKAETETTETSENTETDDVVKAKAPRRRRKAPARSSAASKPAEKAQDAATEDADAKPTRRRRAPAKAKPDASGAEDKPAAKKPAARRKAPAKTKTTAENSVDASEDAAPKPARRRSAPKKAASKSAESKAEASAQAVTESEGSITKPPARKPAAKKAPAKKTPAKKAPAKAATTRKAPAKTAATKKAPVKKTPAKSAAKPQTNDAATSETPPRRRKAPARKTAPKAAPPAETTPAPEPAASTASVTASDETGRRRKAPSRKKRGLLDRLMGKE